ncbi:MAG: hypothetical protein ACOZBZ_03555 [Patescibacteria group bacterium]
MTESSQEALQKPLEGFEPPPEPKTKLEEIIERGKKIVYFPQGTPVWPERKRFSYSQSQIVATRAEEGGKAIRIHGYTGFEALENFVCYRGVKPEPRQNYWTVRAGEKFGAPADKARRKPFNSEIQPKWKLGR